MRTRRAPLRHVRRTPGAAAARRRASLCEALNAVLDTGAIVMGEIVISVADVDLLYLNLNVLISSVETLLNAMETSEREGRPHDPAELHAALATAGGIQFDENDNRCASRVMENDNASR